MLTRVFVHKLGQPCPRLVWTNVQHVEAADQMHLDELALHLHSRMSWHLTVKSCQRPLCGLGAGVATGAIFGHAVATLIAVVGGAFASKYLSEKTIGYVGGTLFLAFAAATLLGVY